MLLVAADLHVLPGTASETRFREFLAWISTTGWDVAFLGDVLELWIGVPGYETPIASDFLAWCRQEKERRRLYFVEGNHEFFVCRHHARCFTDSGTDALDLGEIRLLHGDTIQDDPGHLRFRWWTKSWLSHMLMRFMPGAAAYIRHLQRKLKKKSLARNRCLPQKNISSWATECFAAAPALKWLIVGHFHHPLTEERRDGKRLIVLPAWKDRGEIGLFDGTRCAVTPWEQIARRQNRPPRIFYRHCPAQQEK